METYYFSLVIPNLIIGLCKGSPVLRPYATYFRENLAYKVQQLEPRLVISPGETVNPDAVCSSSLVGNTIIIEWTEAEKPNERKERQLGKYSHVTSKNVIELLAIPSNEANTTDICLIVSTEAERNFNELLTSKKWNFPLLSFTKNETGYILKRCANNFCEKRTNRFFSNDMIFERVPLGYLPLPLDENINEKLVARIVARHALSLLVKGESDKTVEEFCRDYIPIWDKIDIVKRRLIRNATKNTLIKLSAHSSIKEYIQRDKANTGLWHFKGGSVVLKKIRSIQKDINKILAIIEGEKIQLELPFSDENLSRSIL